MAADRPRPTAADYVTLLLSPALITGLVCSLVFFLLEVFYPAKGPWKGRLQWILFFYVLGSVLTARISLMADIAGRSALYGAVLALLTYIGLQLFVEYPDGVKELSFFVNLLLVGVVWWCAHRITRDSTNVDEQTDVAAEGLLQASGLERQPTEKEPEADEKKGWWQRYQEYRERRSKKRTLGVWVVYFSLAALPIFGLGQSLMPTEDAAGRRVAFWLMTAYVACGLGLLLTTCFLGLRRYLRQRRLQMPAAMTGAWLMAGGSLVVGLLVVAALLPQPNGEYSVLGQLTRGGSKERTANRLATKGDAATEGEGKPGEAKKGGKEPGRQSGEKGKGEGREPGGRRDSKGDGKGDKKSDGSGRMGDNKGDKVGKQDDGKKGERRADKGEKARPNDDNKGDKEDAKEGKDGGSSRTPDLRAMHQAMQPVTRVLKWVVFAVLAVLVLVVLLRGGLGFLANFTDWAKRLLQAWRSFWEGLFGRRQAEAEDDAAAVEAERVEPSEPFSAFADPFATGAAQRMPPRELVRYTFRAVEAWAREHGLGRRDDETAQEFLARLGDEFPALEADALRLAGLHARAEYGKGGMPGNTAALLRAFWEKLARVDAAPLSA